MWSTLTDDEKGAACVLSQAGETDLAITGLQACGLDARERRGRGEPAGVTRVRMRQGTSGTGHERYPQDQHGRVRTRIQNGMSEDQVAQIVGSPGTISVDQTVAGYHGVIRTWDGVGGIGANTMVQFQNGKVITKAQAGLSCVAVFASDCDVELLSR